MNSTSVQPEKSFYKWVIEDLRDPQVDSYPLMSSPIPTLLISLTYLFIVTRVGPAFMKNRKAFQLRKTIIAYNGIQVLFSAWMFYGYSRGGWFNGYSLRCQPLDYSQSATALRMMDTCWWYYIAKLTEFFDTFFFILRKKSNQVTPLHVIHHSVMPMNAWIITRFVPGGHATFVAFLNSFIHVVMYSYYMLAALGPHVQPYLWWKKYLTTMQIIQFIAVAIQSFQLLFVECNYPRFTVYGIGSFAVMFLIMFANFYVATYTKSKKKVE